MSRHEMNNKIDITFIPEGCPSNCPVLQSSQSTAMMIAAEAQALFQGFLQCMHKLEPDSQLNPQAQKGSNMLGHFTSKLDLALATEYTHSSQCDYVRDGGTCFKDFNQQINDEKVRQQQVQAQNDQLQTQCQSLENKVEQLLDELSKRRSQYNNRILVQILIDQYKSLLGVAQNGSFFDLVPRDQLCTFLPFLRNIVLGPAISSTFDHELTLALEQYTDHNGHIAVKIWDKVMADDHINNIMHWLMDALFERSQRKKAFSTLLQRKSPVSEQKLPLLITLFETMGSATTIDAMAS